MAFELAYQDTGPQRRAIPVSSDNPLPVEATFAATDGSAAIALGGTAQSLFAGTVPANGYSVSNPDAAEELWISDTTVAVANNTGSILVPPGYEYTSPAGRKPIGAVSVVAATTGHKITASRW